MNVRYGNFRPDGAANLKYACIHYRRHSTATLIRRSCFSILLWQRYDITDIVLIRSLHFGTYPLNTIN
jgi:hypothetical protein